ncbi:hypothetical protein V5799_020575 [Amblyomma americanum]|uniref:M13 family peptidase n=1 Tax=Amblyomma americanum TaxID=6943 RepID=A0AAQ4ETF9_AMBAM
MLSRPSHLQGRTPVKLSGMRNDKAPKKKVAMAVAAAVVVAAIITLALLAASHRAPVIDEDYCTSDECAFHVNMLTARLDNSIDPCEDFSAYVCSSWSRSADYIEFAKSPIDHMLFSRFSRFKSMLEEGTRKLPAGEKARAMYDVCMSTDVDDKGNIENLLPLMQAVGLSWPEQRAHNRSALGVSLALSYKWQLPLWVSVEVPISRNNTKWRLHIKPGDHVPLLWNQYKSVRGGGVYLEYWRGFYSAFRTNFTRPLDESSIEAIADVEGDIVGRLWNSYSSRKRNPAVVPVAKIGDFTPPLSSSTWLEQFNLELELRPRVLEDHEVITRDTEFLATMGALFANYTNEELLGQLAWSFVQFCAPAVDRQLHLVRFGDPWKTKVYKPIFCAFRVELSFKMLIFALDFVSHLTEEDQLIVNEGFSSLISATLAMVNNSAWLDEESRELAANKLASIQTLLWPAPRWLSNEALDALYSAHPSKEETFGDFWIKAHFAAAKQNRTYDFEAAHGLPKNIGPPDFEYDYVLNNIEVPIGIVNRPLYYRRGTKAMFYGGLGFEMALEIVCALDKMGIRWTRDAQKVTSILSEATMQIFDAKDSCLKDEGIETVFPEIPALEIAYSAMVHAIQSDKNSLQVRGLSEEKVFFMTICYMACTSPTGHDLSGANCNKIVRNSPVFQRTFNCPSYSKMNPAKKCYFFA